MHARTEASRIPLAQVHRCQLPDVPDGAEPPYRATSCPRCGQGYRWATTYLNGYPTSSWARSPRFTSTLISEAWTWERFAADLPWWKVMQRWQLRRYAAGARRRAEAERR